MTKSIACAKVAALAALLAASISDSSALACSMCRCGDATFNALGPEVFSAGSFRVALDWERFEKESAGDGGESGRNRLHAAPVTDREVENRFTATVSYTFGDRVNAVARLPWSARRLTSTSAEDSPTSRRASDLSDPELVAYVRLWSADFQPGLGRRAWISASVGVKTPWGRNDLAESGARLDEHLQTGTGSTDLFAGVSTVVLLDPSASVFASAGARRTGTNDFGYRYGNVALANVGYERKLGGVDALLELNWRHAQQDVVDALGAHDLSTGGDVLYLTPRVMLDIGKGFVGRAAIQIPIARSLYGEQAERVVANVGLTVVF